MSDIFELTMEKVLIPFAGKLAVTARNAVLAEIDEQNIIRTGRFRSSIQESLDGATLDIAVNSKDCPYAMYIEVGTTTMQARFPFTKSILRVQEVLNKL